MRSGEMAKLTQLIDNEVFRAYATYATIVLLKMMLMSLITAYFRITRKAFVNPEDTASFGKGESAKKYLRTDPDVERVRRAIDTSPDLGSHLSSRYSIGAATSIFFLATMVLNGSLLYFLLQALWEQRTSHRFSMASLLYKGHLNDLENIVPFLGIGLLYALSGPELSTALLHFRIFTGARIAHTFAYLIPLPQPGRGLSWAVAYSVTISMAYKVLKTALYL